MLSNFEIHILYKYKCIIDFTYYADNFNEMLNRKPDSSNPYMKVMEDAISQYRGSAEKTFSFTRPGEAFRDPTNENIGNS